METTLRPSLRISGSQVKLWRSLRVSRNSPLRTGQHFHNYFRLDRLDQDKEFLDKLYEADQQAADKMIEQITDHNN